VPIGILGSLVICTILYVAVSAVATGIVPYKELGVPDPIAVAMDRTGIPLIPGSSNLAPSPGSPRRCWFYSLSDAGLLRHGAGRTAAPLFARLHDKYGRPRSANGLLPADRPDGGLLPIDILDEMVSIGTLAAFALVCFAVLYLRRHSPAIKRPFRAPGIP